MKQFNANAEINTENENIPYNENETSLLNNTEGISRDVQDREYKFFKNPVLGLLSSIFFLATSIAAPVVLTPIAAPAVMPFILMFSVAAGSYSGFKVLTNSTEIIAGQDSRREVYSKVAPGATIVTSAFIDLVVSRAIDKNTDLMTHVVEKLLYHSIHAGILSALDLYFGSKDIGSKDIGSKDIGSKDIGRKDIGIKDIDPNLIKAAIIKQREKEKSDFNVANHHKNANENIDGSSQLYPNLNIVDNPPSYDEVFKNENNGLRKAQIIAKQREGKNNHSFNRS